MRSRASIRRSPAYASWDASLTVSGPWLHAVELGTIVRRGAGQVLYGEASRHDFFYLIRSGFVHTTLQRPNGTSLLLDIFGPGAIFGEGSSFTGPVRSATATTITPVVLSQYHPAQIADAFAAQPELAVSLIKLLGTKNRLLLNKLTRFTSSDPEERLVELLARVAQTWRDDPYPGDTAADTTHARSIHLTHEQIGAMTALSRVSVTRALKSLADKGLIATGSKNVEIIDREGLIALLGPR
ncbi:Crp/Fnr family transcriptional regulator [Variovorax terrae]|uniref:Crp/Fnr family transcriptional regulator n=1 Tax=Variovorax terrae TaxID=2923278 RepID=A0A9X1VSF3_9BURK|nr:Crp/Fnr family transcriptional regulator [Variovorax terrae]MCJ0762956.1 Crp/Fnr family transcriptional regulator [Variovorax terrae]